VQRKRREIVVTTVSICLLILAPQRPGGATDTLRGSAKRMWRELSRGFWYIAEAEGRPRNVWTMAEFVRRKGFHDGLDPKRLSRARGIARWSPGKAAHSISVELQCGMMPA